MKKVEFEQVGCQISGFGLGKGTKYTYNGLESIIEKRANKGWSFCGYVPLTIRGTGEIETMTLVFEKDE